MSEINQEIYTITINLNLTDAAGRSEYSYLVRADSRAQAMTRLFTYLKETNFPSRSIDRYDIEELRFNNSSVVEML